MARKPHADELGLHYIAHHGQPREWKTKGRCSGLTRSGHPMGQAWNLRTPREKIWVDDVCYSGQELIDFALANCEICPVQWDCARFAVACEDYFSTYSMLGSDMKWLVRSGMATTIIDAAEAANVSMQRAVDLARQRATITTCQVSVQPRSSTKKSTSTSPTATSTGSEQRRSRDARSKSGTRSRVA